MVTKQKILQTILFFFVFLLLVGTVFWGMQWFSVSLGGLLIHPGSFFTSSLQGPIPDALASGNELPNNNIKTFPYRNWQVEELGVQAQGAISVEVENGKQKVLFKKDEQKKLPIASLTKLMTALIVLDGYDLSQKITIDKEAMAQEGEQGALKEGQVLSVKDLLYITLMESSNRSAFALAKASGLDNFIVSMNDKAVAMGLSNTHFQDTTGLDEGSYSTVKDLVVLSTYLFEHYPLFREIVSLKEYNLYLQDGTLHHTLENTNNLLGQVSANRQVIGGKTGYTKSAKGCFMALQMGFGSKSYIINIVLGSEDRDAEMKTLIDWVGRAYQWQ